MKTNNMFKILFILMILFSIGCSKDGEPGPKGDTGTAGPKGDKGDKGDTGDTGPQGEKGTANVMYSEWMNFDWNVSDEPTFKQMGINIPEITEEFIEEGGIVLVYLRAFLPPSTTVMVQFPYSFGNNRLFYGLAIVPAGTVSPDFENGLLLNVDSMDGADVSDFQDVAGSGGIDYDFRYILIPGGLKLTSGRYSSDNIDYKNLQMMFNIPD